MPTTTCPMVMPRSDLTFLTKEDGQILESALYEAQPPCQDSISSIARRYCLLFLGVVHFRFLSRDVDYKGFLEFLESRLAKAYASAKGIEHDVAVQELKDKLAGASPQLHGATKASSDAATARLTDVRNYTGAHKERFDPSTGKGKGKLGREDAPPAFTAAGISAPRK
ncbi:unnamed protein product [Schistocephalus solidus]|uniref:Tubulin polymerization-promoting protein family member 3 n=1 Tax=Schistocephalus solidus TaxID=70667 RepID=A0A3P7EWV9_SCHSO|nr:unnamed protein product [Schistocephalus solidus]